MRKKLLSFMLALCLIVPCGVVFTACGDTPPPENHTHEWVDISWESNSTEHWHKCKGCDEKKDKGNHSLVEGVCSICDYDINHSHEYTSEYIKDNDGHWQKCIYCEYNSTKESHNFNGNSCLICGFETTVSHPELPVVENVRDLSVISMATEVGGYCTLVLLPDGKNLVVNSGSDDLYSEMGIDQDLLLAYNVETIDYLVLTNTAEQMAGGADYIFEYYPISNLYIPYVGNNITPSTQFNTAVEIANGKSNCMVTTIGENNCDIDYSFKDRQGDEHNYKVDFMMPVDFASATNDQDATVVIAIEYKGKTIMLGGFATNNNIENYCSKYGTKYNVDVLFTNYLMGDNKDAIRNSAVNGQDYLSKISLGQGDYMVMCTNNGITGAGDLNVAVSILGVDVFAIRSNDTTTAIAIITNAGVLSVNDL